MTIHGSCLCGAVRFQFERAIGPFEICHCNRCRKVSGGQGMPSILVPSTAYKMTHGKEMLSSYEAPLLYGPPAYQNYFCFTCGSPVPSPHPSADMLEVPAGLLDEDPGMKPDKHIFVEFIPAWDRITDDLPQYDLKRLVRERQGLDLADDFKLWTHYDEDSTR
ncbi:MAG: hypothetical protein ACI9CE_000591 [Flavobacterium sp.]|jgi:hypothetical protein